MNRTIIRLAVVAPLAASAVAFGASTAHAELNPNGPVVIGTPEEDPLDGPDDIAVPKPKPKPNPQGPKDLAAPAPKPVVDPHAPQGNGGGSAPAADTKKASTGSDADQAEAASHRVVDLNAESRLGGTTLPAADETVAAQEDEGGLSIVWFLAGGAVVTATGVAARKYAKRA
ncbi:hypothetical protein [Aeromicrobium terrae]|uniref:LPXTG cell wall anchor domain-containing protein n=1 Tax=Aeromicrobium terrae TaxID=2498846 RepID=A0A5C8NDX1_9ACTN|nr:hypothetical protein [Aeromicrobium terrae]TXL57682.1 hypothetical protein FHP06_12925 [Aeromicrobium terrae]